MLYLASVSSVLGLQMCATTHSSQTAWVPDISPEVKKAQLSLTKSQYALHPQSSQTRGTYLGPWKNEASKPYLSSLQVDFYKTKKTCSFYCYWPESRLLNLLRAETLLSCGAFGQHAQGPESHPQHLTKLGVLEYNYTWVLGGWGQKFKPSWLEFKSSFGYWDHVSRGEKKVLENPAGNHCWGLSWKSCGWSSG